MKLHRGIVAGIVTLAGLGLFLCPPVQAQDLGQVAASLKLVPADAATYGVMLRNREQLESIAKSKAWAKFSALPFVKMLWQKLDEEWSGEQGKLAGLKKWYEEQGGRDLVSLLRDLAADEIGRAHV